MRQSLGRELWGTPSRVNNFNAATYALLGAAFVAAGVACMLFPAQTMAGVFGSTVAATAGPQAALMWQLVGAGISCCVGGACYALKVCACVCNWRGGAERGGWECTLMSFWENVVSVGGLEGL
jgi:hypothetical protein